MFACVDIVRVFRHIEYLNYRLLFCWDIAVVRKVYTSFLGFYRGIYNTLFTFKENLCNIHGERARYSVLSVSNHVVLCKVTIDCVWVRRPLLSYDLI